MIFSNNSQKKIQNIIKKIENENSSESNIVSLCELLENHRNMIPDSIRALNKIIIKGNLKASYSAIHALNKLSENYTGLEYYSIYVLISCVMERKNDLDENSMLKILEILSKITQKYPERMKIAVPELLICLENSNAFNRTLSYFMLSILAVSHPEFFKGHSKRIIRILNGLYVDERIYACRLIKQLAQKDQTTVTDTYDILEDLWLNNLDCNVRSEAGFALDMLKEVSGMIPSESYFSGLKELRSPNKNDLIDIIEGMNLRHMIINS